MRHSVRDGVRRIWLTGRGAPPRRSLLYEHNRYAEVLFSPDEEWIAVTDYYFSNESEVLLFKRRAGLEYERVKAANIREKAWRLFARQQNPARLDLDHTYVRGARWLRDSSGILIELKGHGRERRLDAWLFTFDVRTLEPKSFPGRTDPRAHKKRRASGRKLRRASR